MFQALSHYCSAYPKLIKTKFNGKIFWGINFYTRILPCLQELYNLFYPEGKKIIPHNIYSLLSWPALAHWVYLKSNIKFLYFNSTRRTKSYGLYIDVNNFSIKDIVRLISVLIFKFNF